MNIAEQIKQIINSPLLPQIFSQIQEKLNEEQAKRKEFYEKINEEVKAEFIYGKIIYHSPAKASICLLSEIFLIC